MSIKFTNDEGVPIQTELPNHVLLQQLSDTLSTAIAFRHLPRSTTLIVETIEALIDLKIRIALDEISDRIEDALGARP